MANWDEERELSAEEQWLVDQQEQYGEDLAHLMGDPRFRRFMWQLLGKCRVFTTNMTGNAWTQFYEGKRDVGIELTRDMHVSPDGYMAMWRENAQPEDFKPVNKDK